MLRTPAISGPRPLAKIQPDGGIAGPLHRVVLMKFFNYADIGKSLLAWGWKTDKAEGDLIFGLDQEARKVALLAAILDEMTAMRREIESIRRAVGRLPDKIAEAPHKARERAADKERRAADAKRKADEAAASVPVVFNATNEMIGAAYRNGRVMRRF